jgi:uncharacterized membrane protein
MNKKWVEVVIIFAITIVASIWFYRAIKGSMEYDTISEFLSVLLVAFVIATIISILYLMSKRRKNNE